VTFLLRVQFSYHLMVRSRDAGGPRSVSLFLSLSLSPPGARRLCVSLYSNTSL